MDFKLFIKSLSKGEKEDLRNILNNNFEVEAGLETIENFFYRHSELGNLSTRLRRSLYSVVYSNSYSEIKEKNIDDISDEDFIKIRGAGMRTFQEFEELRYDDRVSKDTEGI